MLYSKLIDKPASFFEARNSGEIVSLINNEGRVVGDWLSSGILVLFNEFTVLILNLAMMLYYNVEMSLIVIAGILLIYFSTKSIASYMAKLSSESYKITGKINQFILQTIKSEKLIHTLSKHSWFKGRFNRLVYGSRYPLERKIADANAIYLTVFLFLSYLLPVLTVVVGSALSSQYGITAGMLLAFYALTARLQEPIQFIPNFLSERKNAIALADHLLPLLENDDAPTKKAVMLSDKIEKLEIKIKGYSYSNDSVTILNNTDITVEANDIIVIKGKSGIGKTTLVNLIMGFLSIENGSIRLNGVDTHLLSNEELWKHILFVEQEPQLIEGTLEENLYFGDAYSEEDFKEVLFTVCLDDFVQTFDMNRIIGGDNDGISGGQKQRINIARMLIRKPDVIVLDEPTSALDSTTSFLIADRVVEYSKRHGITLFIISHGADFDRHATAIINLE